MISIWSRLVTYLCAIDIRCLEGYGDGLRDTDGHGHSGNQLRASGRECDAHAFIRHGCCSLLSLSALLLRCSDTAECLCWSSRCQWVTSLLSHYTRSSWEVSAASHLLQSTNRWLRGGLLSRRLSWAFGCLQDRRPAWQRRTAI
jgi:hypothetical protein